MTEDEDRFLIQFRRLNPLIKEFHETGAITGSEYVKMSRIMNRAAERLLEKRYRRMGLPVCEFVISNDDTYERLLKELGDDS